MPQKRDASTAGRRAHVSSFGKTAFFLWMDVAWPVKNTQPDTVFPVPCSLLGDALTHLRAFGENEVAVQIGAHKVCFSDETLKLYVRRYGVDTYDPDAAIPKAYREVITVKTDELLRELTYLKECIGSCTFPYVRFAGQDYP